MLQVGSVEKSTGSGSGGPKITGSDRIRIQILIPAAMNPQRSTRALYLGAAAGQNVHLMLGVEAALQKVGKVFCLQAS